MSIIQEFLSKVDAIYKTGAATEHSYRSSFEFLFASFGDDIVALNEPKRVKCGAPDFIIYKGDIVIGHVEAKDLHVGLRGMKDTNKNQQDRYRKALSNLVYTNCLDWDFYREGEIYASVKIADIGMGLQPNPDKFDELEHLLRDYIAQRPQSITSPKNLAERMAGKAILIKDVLQNVLREDENLQTELAGQYHAFKEHLIHDITPTDFADIYAETIAYGMFAARLHDKTPDTFNRQEALELLPKSNPFLRSLFGYIAGHDLDERIEWIIDDLADVFRAADVAKLMEGFGKLTGQSDPFLHFYETFLAAYNPAKRKARGVWYTPEPVVNFIVRAVDEVLQTEFELPDGLADTSKVTIDWDTGQVARNKDGSFSKKGKTSIIKKEVHRVQILDPAVGTGTFLAEVIKLIAPRVKNVAEGKWSGYIEKDLIPRLHGFELLMASYAMCHMKLDMILTELGYKPRGNSPRLGVYLTNSLEEGEPANQSLPFAQWLSNEVKQANTIKRDMPIMCVMGNPPYSGQSSNKGPWITGLMEAYKYEPGGKIKLQERNPKWINNDYVKFIRMAEHLIEKNGEGILAFITSNSYLESPTFRGMRWYLLKNFDRVLILNLHGDSNIKEVTPDGTIDKNVFDIMEGVSIIVAFKRKTNVKNNNMAELFYHDLWGSRDKKHEFLTKSNIKQIKWEKLEYTKPYYFFKPKSYSEIKQYEKGFSLKEAFNEYRTGYYTSCDDHVIGFNNGELVKKLKSFLDQDQGIDPSLIRDTTFRPLDNRVVYYDPSLLSRSRKNFVNKLPHDNNLILVAGKSTKNNEINHFFVTSTFSELKCAENTKGSYMFPTYLKNDDKLALTESEDTNFNQALFIKMKNRVGSLTPESFFDFIYGALYCPDYRETYREFLKIDFPRIPWPSTPDEFWDVSAKGSVLRKLHLMKPATIGDTPYQFKGEGDDIVDKPRFDEGKIWINATQFFDAAPPVSWDFYIGGYQPARKWLKDRKGRELSFDDVRHYQRILKILSETDRIMETITMTLDA